MASEPGGMASMRGQAEGAVLHRLVSTSAFICLELLGRGPGVRVAHDALPDVVQADVGGDVDRSCPPFRASRSSRPASSSSTSLPRTVARWALQFALVRPGRVAFAEHLRRHALADLALGVAVFEQDVIGVRVHVDEAGRDDQALGVDLAALAGPGTRPTATMRSPRTATSP